MADPAREDDWAIPADLADVTRDEALFMLAEIRGEMFGKDLFLSARWRAAAWRSQQATRAADAAMDAWLACNEARRVAEGGASAKKRDAAVALANAEKTFSDLQRKSIRLQEREKQLFDALIAERKRNHG